MSPEKQHQEFAQFENTHAVVTGGGTGIGAAIVSALLKGGARVSLMGRRLDVLQKAADQYSKPDQTQPVSCDVVDEQSVREAFQAAVARFGPVNILVNCAGTAPAQAFHKLTAQEWNQVIAVNLGGVFHCTREVIGTMREQKSGRIVNIASTSSLKGYAYVSAYCAAKHGVLGLTRALALETAQQGITVNAVCPGYTDTTMIRTSIANIVEKTGRSEAEAYQEFTRTNPQNRLIEPREIATTVLWLCAASSASITGQAISLSGGEVM